MAFKPMRDQYSDDIVPALMDEFGYKNIMEVPKITKVVINIGMGEALDDSKAIERAVGDLTLITGQKPIVTKAKTSIAGFKLREGRAIGTKVTMRNQRMWDFLTRLIHLALPRTRDFQGVNPDAFDGRGNYTLGLTEQLIFPEIEFDQIDKLRGMEISIVTTAKTDEEGRKLLSMLGMPFYKN